MSAAVIRLKRKASCEPIEGLVIALKKSKSDEDINSNEVYFKFAATLKNDKESIKDHIQAALSKDRDSKFSKWRSPKRTTMNQKNVYHICEKVRKEYKAASEKKKLKLLNDRRLIFTETVSIDDEENDDSEAQSAEIRKLLQLYDIIEENEEPKTQVKCPNIKDDNDEIVTCNEIPLIRDRLKDYVYDVYIADCQIDDCFVKNTVSLRPCTVTNDDIYSGDSDDNSEIYEDEDDSNDENNWRNEYPEDEDSRSEPDSEDELFEEGIHFDREVGHSVSRVFLGGDSDDEWLGNSDLLEPLYDDYAGSD